MASAAFAASARALSTANLARTSSTADVSFSLVFCATSARARSTSSRTAVARSVARLSAATASSSAVCARWRRVARRPSPARRPQPRRARRPHRGRRGTRRILRARGRCRTGYERVEGGVAVRRGGGLAHLRRGVGTPRRCALGIVPSRVAGGFPSGAYRLHPGVEGIEGRLGGRDGGLSLVELVRGGGVERAGGLRDVVGGSGGERRVRWRANAGELEGVARRFDRWTERRGEKAREGVRGSRTAAVPATRYRSAIASACSCRRGRVWRRWRASSRVDVRTSEVRTRLAATTSGFPRCAPRDWSHFPSQHDAARGGARRRARAVAVRAARGVGSSPRIGETPRARLGVRATPDTGRGRVSSRVLRTSRRSPFSNGISRARSRPVPGVRAPRVSRPPGRSRRSHRYDDDRRGRDRGRGRGGRPRARRQLVLPLPRERHGGRDPTPGGRRAVGLGRLRRRRGRRRAVQDATSGRVPRRPRRRRRRRLVVLRRGRRSRQSRMGPSTPSTPSTDGGRRRHMGHRRRRRDPPAPHRPRSHRRRRLVAGVSSWVADRRERARAAAAAAAAPSTSSRSTTPRAEPPRSDATRCISPSRTADGPSRYFDIVRGETQRSAGDATGVVDGWRGGRSRFYRRGGGAVARGTTRTTSDTTRPRRPC